jgi:putative autotransporter adhesin-like protein
MKTQILAIFTALILITGIATTTKAATAKNETVTVLNNISAISKIEVRGNVELYISDGSKDQVKVYNQYYNENALVQSKNGTLSIASYKAEKLIVWVTAADLRSVSAYDNAQVKSFGRLSEIEFNIDLHNSASANLDLDAFIANITVSDEAKAHLTGSANEYDLKYRHLEKIDQKDLVTIHASKTLTAMVSDKKIDINDMVDL